MNLLRYKPLFRWAVPLAIILTLAAGAIVATRIVWAGDGPNGQRIDVYYFDWGVRTCRVGPNQTLIEDVIFETVDGYAFQVPSGNASMTCTFEITDPALLPDQSYHNMGWLCSTPVFGGTYNSKLIVRQDGTMILICHWNGSSSNVSGPSAYTPPDTPASSGDGAPPTGQSSGSDAGSGTGTGDTSTSASDASTTGDTSGNTVDGAGATVEPQGGDNNNGAPPDHAGPQDNSNGNPPDHAGPQDNHDGIDKPNGNGNGNNGNGNGNGGG